MNDEIFTTRALHVNFLGIQLIELPDKERRVLLYFTREPDTADVPLALTERQAEQLFEDLKKLFPEYAND